MVEIIAGKKGKGKTKVLLDKVNEAVKTVGGNIVYLEHPAVWYTAEGGITALDIMLQDLESALGVSAAAAE